MKFKVGDKVRIRKNLEDIPDFEGGLTSDMKGMENNIVTIKKVETRGYILAEDFMGYLWDERAFESVLTSDMFISCDLDGRQILTDITTSPFATLSDCDINISEKNKEEKEKEKMDCEKILRIYEDRKIREIEENYEAEKAEILEKDELYIVASEMIEQMNAILDEDGQDTEVQALSENPRYLLKETRESMKCLEENRNNEYGKVNKKLNEIRAMLEIAPNYEEAIKILINYNVIDKKTKKIVEI